MINLITGKICIEGYCLANPHYLYYIIPLVFVLLILLWINFVKFKKDEEKKAFVKEHRGDRIVFFVLRSIVFFLLLIAIASPYKLKETSTQGSPALTILADNSSSFEMFDNSIATELKGKLEEYFPTTLNYIAFGERSAIGDGILQNAEGDDHILVISDGYNNYGRDLGDIILFSSVLNTTIHTVRLEPTKKDVSIVVNGPSQVIEQSETTFNVVVRNVGNLNYNAEVVIDGAQVPINNKGEFTWRFSRGYHKIRARILFPGEDHFEQNNVYYKSVKSLPRPKLLFVTEKGGPLKEALEKVYDVTIKDEIPNDIKGYDAVILNDINANKISDSKVDLLSDYLSEKGNGVVVVGGDNSFDNGGYKGSYFESLLPVKVGVGERKRDERYNVVFVIDLSGTTTLPFKPGAEQSIIDFEKAFLLDIIHSLNFDDEISIIGFVSRPHCIPTSLHCILTPILSLPGLDTTISTLGVPSGPNADRGTNIALALARARGVLEKAEGGKNVVLISDGIDTNEYGIMQGIQTMNSFGIKLYTIGVGQFVNSKLLKKMAEKGDGIYLEPDETEKLKIIFMGDEEEQRCATAKSGRMVLMDTAHWITKNTELSANVGGYNLVVPELWGRRLIATDCDRTIMTAGRYGLGRIVVMSTDDGSKWSGDMFGRENSKIITRMINWAIGDFTKDNDFDVRVRDVTLGKATDINVISNEKPEVKGFEFSKIDTGLYSAKLRPKKVGFYPILDAVVGVSYNDEYEKLGINPELGELVTISGGQIFAPDDVEGIRDTIISMSRRVKVETINYRWPFVIAAMVIFLIDVLIRRIRENMNMMKM